MACRVHAHADRLPGHPPLSHRRLLWHLTACLGAAMVAWTELPAASFSAVICHVIEVVVRSHAASLRLERIAFHSKDG